MNVKEMLYICVFSVFFFKQKTAYEMRISDWSSDVCSSDLCCAPQHIEHPKQNPPASPRKTFAASFPPLPGTLANTTTRFQNRTDSSWIYLHPSLFAACPIAAPALT